MNAIELNKAMNLKREVYNDRRFNNLSYDMKLWKVSDHKLRDKLFDMMCEYEEGFYEPLSDLIEDFNSRYCNEYHESIATMDGRSGGHLCLNLRWKTGDYGEWYDSDALLTDKSPAGVDLKRAFRKLAEDIRKYYLEWAKEELSK